MPAFRFQAFCNLSSEKQFALEQVALDARVIFCFADGDSEAGGKAGIDEKE